MVQLFHLASYFTDQGQESAEGERAKLLPVLWNLVHRPGCDDVTVVLRSSRSGFRKFFF